MLLLSVQPKQTIYADLRIIKKYYNNPNNNCSRFTLDNKPNRSGKMLYRHVRIKNHAINYNMPTAASIHNTEHALL